MLPNQQNRTYVWGRYMLGFVELFEELGGDVQQLIQETGCPASVLYGTSDLIPYSYCGYLLEVAAQQVGRSDFSLLLADRRLEINYARDAVLYMRAARNLELAVRGVLEHMRTRSLGIEYLLESEGNVAWISRSLGSKEDSRYPQGALLFFATISAVLRSLSESHWTLTSISMISRAPDNSAALDRYFGCPIDFNADQDAMYFPAHFLGYTLPARDDSVHALMSEYLASQYLEDKPDFRDSVKNIIMRNLALGRPDIEAASWRLPYRPRTIQRKLAERGTTYSEVLNEARFELAENLLLNSDNPLTYVAQRLCYKDLSAFSKAFKARYGTSPRDWRRVQKTTAAESRT